MTVSKFSLFLIFHRAKTISLIDMSQMIEILGINETYNVNFLALYAFVSNVLSEVSFNIYTKDIRRRRVAKLTQAMPSFML